MFLIGTIIGTSGASYTAISAMKSLDDLNDYTFAPTEWTTLATGSNYNYVTYDGDYNYIIGVNVTAVGTFPKFNVIKGTNPPAFRAELGNLVYSLTNNKVHWFGPLESARFVNSTGYLQFSTTNVTTGTIMVLKVHK